VNTALTHKRFSGGRGPSSAASFTARWISNSSSRLRNLPLWLLFLLAALLTVQLLLTAGNASDKNERSTPMPVANFEDGTKDTKKDTKDIFGEVSGSDGVLSDSVGLKNEYRSRAHDEWIIAKLSPQWPTRQELLPRPPPQK
jgi:hypothetical protein